MYKVGTYSCRNLSITITEIPTKAEIIEIEEFIKIRPETESLIRDNNKERTASNDKTKPKQKSGKRSKRNANPDKSEQADS